MRENKNKTSWESKQRFPLMANKTFTIHGKTKYNDILIEFDS
jgi:hypothetical protein